MGSLSGMTYKIRTFGDPVLLTQAATVTDIDGKVINIVEKCLRPSMKVSLESG